MAQTEAQVAEDGPSVDSDQMEERIMARRLRITRRIEAAKLEADGEDMNQKKIEPEKELSKSRKQIEHSQQRLGKLQLDGTELVSNVEVACDAREAGRRVEEDEAKRLRIEKLEGEVKAAAEKFEEITKKWDTSLSREIPQDLNNMLTEQKGSCDAVVAEKDKLIGDLQMELKSKDDQYVKDLRKQAEDIDLMLERMEEQMKSLRRAYREELDTIENAFFTERKGLLEVQQKKELGATEQRQEKEVEYVKLRVKRVNDFDSQLQTLRVQDAEEYNMVKIKLETDVQILEQNLQQMKATYQLNQEKLEYNFQVLKKRDEENTITKSQQKRKITRLQDLLNNLKQKLKKQEKGYGDENQSLTDDLKRITEQYKELQKKFRHFQATDNKRFSDVWKMNEDQIKELVSDVLAEDRIIFEQQLGLQWEAPDLDFMNNTGPITTLNTRTAMEAVNDVLSDAGSEASRPPSNANEQAQVAQHADANATASDMHLEQPSISSNIAPDVLKRMLELLCDESGFLVEEKLTKLLAPIEKNEQSLMKLDAIFNAIGVETEQDILALSQYLLEPRQGEMAIPPGGVGEEVSEEMTADTEASGEAIQARPPVENALIAPNDVIAVLRQFVEDHREPYKESRSQQTRRFGVHPARNASLDEEYWQKLAGVMDAKSERVWDAMIDGFEKYQTVLTERATLIHDTDALRQQNAELRMLLRQYLNAKVNQELEIPPTRVLQLEMSRE